MQGLQERLPGQRRHGDLQGRVHVASLSRSAAAACRVRHGPDLVVQSHRQPHAAIHQHRARGAAVRTLRQMAWRSRSEEHTSELQSLMRISYAVFCLKKKNTITKQKKYNSRDEIL